jgi:hypothetical protein
LSHDTVLIILLTSYIYVEIEGGRNDLFALVFLLSLLSPMFLSLS